MAKVVPAGTQPPYYLRFVDPDWRGSPAARQATEDRMAAAAQTGAQLFVERLRLEWRPGTPVPAPTGRLSFRPVTSPYEVTAIRPPDLAGTFGASSTAKRFKRYAEEYRMQFSVKQRPGLTLAGAAEPPLKYARTPSAPSSPSSPGSTGCGR